MRQLALHSACVASATRSPAVRTDGVAPEIGQQSAQPTAMQVAVAEYPAASHAYAAFDQIDSAAARVTVGGDLGAAKDFELRHRISRCRGDVGNLFRRSVRVKRG
jgi:hypothetical protein